MKNVRWLFGLLWSLPIAPSHTWAAAVFGNEFDASVLDRISDFLSGRFAAAK
jgi:hypothetical protein